MSQAVASLLIRRRCTVLGLIDPLRCFSTQTLTTLRNRSDEGGARRRGVPKLMVLSGDDENPDPQSCRLFSLTGRSEGKERTFLKLERETHLPETAAADKTQCMGSSEGILFTFRTEKPREISAVDPLTGTHLPLPSASTLQRRNSSDLGLNLSDCKALLSPSCDVVILNRMRFLDFARLGGRGGGGGSSSEPARCWTPLRIGIMRAHDIIFHKGLLHAVDSDGDVVVVSDLNNPLQCSFLLGNDVLGREDKDYTRSCLVESPDGRDLFLLYRKESYSTSFKVFKLNQRSGNWNRVRSIGDMAIFVGINQSISLRTKDFPGILKPNSVYFTTDFFQARYDLSSKKDGVVYCLDDASTQHFELTDG